MPVPVMPSLTDLPIEELEKEGVALQVITEKLGEIKDNQGEGNCGYYAVAIGLRDLNKNLAGKTIPKTATTQNKKAALAMRKRLLAYGKQNAHHIIRNDKNTTPIFILFREDSRGHSHLYNFYNYPTEEEREKAFMDYVGNSIFTDDFEDIKEEGIGIEFYMEANGTLPLIASKYNVNFTLYDIGSISTTYFYHHDSRVCVWRSKGLCRPVADSIALVLEDQHYQTILLSAQTRKEMEISPEVDRGPLILDDPVDNDRARAEVESVIDDDESTSKNSDKVGNSDDPSDVSMEKMPKPKDRKFKEKKGDKEEEKETSDMAIEEFGNISDGNPGPVPLTGPPDMELVQRKKAGMNDNDENVSRESDKFGESNQDIKKIRK